MRYLIEHESLLAFPKPVREHQFELRLAPREDAGLRRIACEVTVEPGAPLRTHLDCFGNLVHRVTLLAPHESLRVRATSEVETLLANPFDFEPLPVAGERRWLEQRLREDPSLFDFVLHRSEAVPDLASPLGDLAAPRFECGTPLIENALALLAWAEATFRYVPGTTEVHGALAAFAEKRAGVCQDFAHLVVAVVRSWGFPARYVMGYADPGSVGLGERREQATHAWAELLIPGAGWRGFDATAGLVANDGYVPVAVGRDSRDTAPLRGTFKGDEGGRAPQVAVKVERIEQPRQEPAPQQVQIQ